MDVKYIDIPPNWYKIDVTVNPLFELSTARV